MTKHSPVDADARHPLVAIGVVSAVQTKKRMRSAAPIAGAFSWPVRASRNRLYRVGAVLSRHPFRRDAGPRPRHVSRSPLPTGMTLPTKELTLRI